MFTKEEIKEFIIKFGKRVFFPDVSNRISKYVMVAGVAIIAGINPYSIVLLNWFVDLFNKSNESGFSIPHFSDGRVDYIWGVLLVLAAITHNILYQWIKFSQEKAHLERIHAKDMLVAEVAELQKIKDADRIDIQTQQLIEADRKLFSSFLELLPSNSEAIDLIERHDFGSSYRYGATDNIEKFVNEWSNVEKKFHDVTLEESKHLLYSKCCEFICAIQTYSGPIGNGSRACVVPQGTSDYNIPRHILDYIDQINNISSECFKLHQNFVSACRETLKC